MRKTFTLVAFFLLSLSLSAQNLSGIWQGVLFQPNPTGIYYFVYTITIQQTGNTISATSYASAYNTPYYAYYKTIGTVSNNILSFQDTEITDYQAPSGSGWCIKYGDLTFDPALEKLSGRAQGLNGCPPFDIELYRLTIKADTLHCTPQAVPILTTGQNIRWYADMNKQTLLGSGNTFTPFVYQTTTYYVTQTIYDTESPVVPYTIHINTTAANTYTQNRTICTGESITVGDTTYKTSGIYVKKLLTTEGCDSLVTTNLTVKSAIQKTQTLSICNAQSVVVGDTTYKTSGIYVKKLLSTEGCDSIVTTNLTVKSAIQKSQTLSICNGQSVTVGDTIYKTSGIYTKRFIAVGGCDSLVTTNLIVRSAIQKSQTLSICNGQNVAVGDTIYRTTGIYVKKLLSTEGCDSIITTNLTVNSTIQKTQALSICQGQSVIVGDTTYKTSGIYIKHLRSIGGCDSIVTTNLKFLKFDLDIPTETTIRLGDSIQITALAHSTEPLLWKWTPNSFLSCDTCSAIWITPKKSIVYKIEVTDKNKQCKEQRDFKVYVNKQCNIFIPTAFSPNDDSFNDVFKVYFGNCIKQIKRYAIFNRWGNLMISKENPNLDNGKEVNLWDGLMNGQLANIGIYAYFLEIEYWDGEVEVLKGDVTVMK